MKHETIAPLIFTVAFVALPLAAPTEAAENENAQQSGSSAQKSESQAGAAEGSSGESDEEVGKSKKGSGNEKGARGNYLAAQEEGELLAGELDGASVRSPNDDALGDVQDVLVGEGKGIIALVVGVGGFLGIGEKNVAVDYEMFDVSRDEAGGIILTLDASKEALEGAPEFKTLAQKKKEEMTRDLQQQQKEKLQQQQEQLQQQKQQQQM